MAELIGLTASIIGIAGAGVKLSTALYTFAESASRADQDITDIAGDVALTANVLDSVGNALKEDETKCVASRAALNDAEHILKRCETVFGDIRQIVEKRTKIGKDGQKSITTLGRLAWPLKEQRVELMRRRLDSLKTSLLLLLKVLSFAGERARGKEASLLLEERENIRALHKRQQESLENLSTLEKRLDKFSLDDSETLHGSTNPSRTSTINITAQPSPTFLDAFKKTEAPIKCKDPEPLSEDSDDTIGGSYSGSEDESISAEDLAACSKHIQKLLRKIESLQDLVTPAKHAQRSKRRVHKAYRRFCLKIEKEVLNIPIVGLSFEPPHQEPQTLPSIDSLVVRNDSDIKMHQYRQQMQQKMQQRMQQQIQQQMSQMVSQSPLQSSTPQGESAALPSVKHPPSQQVDHSSIHRELIVEQKTATLPNDLPSQAQGVFSSSANERISSRHSWSNDVVPSSSALVPEGDGLSSSSQQLDRPNLRYLMSPATSTSEERPFQNDPELISESQISPGALSLPPRKRMSPELAASKRLRIEPTKTPHSRDKSLEKSGLGSYKLNHPGELSNAYPQAHSLSFKRIGEPILTPPKPPTPIDQNCFCKSDAETEEVLEEFDFEDFLRERENQDSSPSRSLSRNDITGNVEDYTVSCICGFSDDDGNTVLCGKCNMWQHIICYYDDARNVPNVHDCAECAPRQLDSTRAAEKQRELRRFGGARKMKGLLKSHEKKANDAIVKETSLPSQESNNSKNAQLNGTTNLENFDFDSFLADADKGPFPCDPDSSERVGNAPNHSSAGSVNERPLFINPKQFQRILKRRLERQGLKYEDADSRRSGVRRECTSDSSITLAHEADDEPDTITIDPRSENNTQALCDYQMYLMMGSPQGSVNCSGMAEFEPPHEIATSSTSHDARSGPSANEAPATTDNPARASGLAAQGDYSFQFIPFIGQQAEANRAQEGGQRGASASNSSRSGAESIRYSSDAGTDSRSSITTSHDSQRIPVHFYQTASQMNLRTEASGLGMPQGSQQNSAMSYLTQSVDQQDVFNSQQWPPAYRPQMPNQNRHPENLQDYSMQLMLLEQQNKRRLMFARAEQEARGVTFSAENNDRTVTGSPSSQVDVHSSRGQLQFQSEPRINASNLKIPPEKIRSPSFIASQTSLPRPTSSPQTEQSTVATTTGAPDALTLSEGVDFSTPWNGSLKFSSSSGYVSPGPGHDYSKMSIGQPFGPSSNPTRSSSSASFVEAMPGSSYPSTLSPRSTASYVGFLGSGTEKSPVHLGVTSQMNTSSGDNIMLQLSPQQQSEEPSEAKPRSTSSSGWVQYQVNNSNNCLVPSSSWSKAIRRRRGRTTGLNPDQRKSAAVMRAIEPCDNCRRRKERCDPGVPCKSCIEHYKGHLVNHPCRGGPLRDGLSSPSLSEQSVGSPSAIDSHARTPTSSQDDNSLDLADTAIKYPVQHKSAKPFQCSFCPRRFVLADTLRRHLRNHSHLSADQKNALQEAARKEQNDDTKPLDNDSFHYSMLAKKPGSRKRDRSDEELHSGNTFDGASSPFKRLNAGNNIRDKNEKLYEDEEDIVDVLLAKWTVLPPEEMKA